mmetsp:Transcript_30052/g.89160  ORF Transcript_30052/g.89160 Transcript_30052/m.89160 type:complete len:525 (+) Transcript_30052:3-1577(+)
MLHARLKHLRNGAMSAADLAGKSALQDLGHPNTRRGPGPEALCTPPHSARARSHPQHPVSPHGRVAASACWWGKPRGKRSVRRRWIEAVVKVRDSLPAAAGHALQVVAVEALEVSGAVAVVVAVALADRQRRTAAVAAGAAVELGRPLRRRARLASGRLVAVVEVPDAPPAAARHGLVAAALEAPQAAGAVLVAVAVSLAGLQVLAPLAGAAVELAAARGAGARRAGAWAGAPARLAARQHAGVAHDLLRRRPAAAHHAVVNPPIAGLAGDLAGVEAGAAEGRDVLRAVAEEVDPVVGDVDAVAPVPGDDLRDRVVLGLVPLAHDEGRVDMAPAGPARGARRLPQEGALGAGHQDALHQDPAHLRAVAAGAPGGAHPDVAAPAEGAVQARGRERRERELAAAVGVVPDAVDAAVPRATPALFAGQGAVDVEDAETRFRCARPPLQGAHRLLDEERLPLRPVGGGGAWGRRAGALGRAQAPAGRVGCPSGAADLDVLVTGVRFCGARDAAAAADKQKQPQAEPCH